MKNISVNFLLTSFLVVSLSSCSFDKDNNDDKQRKLNQNDQCPRIEGTYGGSIQTVKKEIPTEVGIYCQPKSVGVDSEGKTLTKNVIYVVISRTDFAIRQTFEFDYEPNSQKFYSVNSSTPSTEKETNSPHTAEDSLTSSVNIEPFTGFTGRNDGSTISGNLLVEKRPFGTLTVQKRTNAFEMPYESGTTETVQKIYKVVQPYEGKYCGLMVPQPSVEAPYAAEISVSLVPIVSETVNYAVKANLRRLQGQWNGILFGLKLFFDIDSTPMRLFASIVSSSSNQSGFKVSLEGQIDGLDYAGTFTDQKLNKGRFFLTKRPNCFDVAEKYFSSNK